MIKLRCLHTAHATAKWKTYDKLAVISLYDVDSTTFDNSKARSLSLLKTMKSLSNAYPCTKTKIPSQFKRVDAHKCSHWQTTNFIMLIREFTILAISRLQEVAYNRFTPNMEKQKVIRIQTRHDGPTTKKCKRKPGRSDGSNHTVQVEKIYTRMATKQRTKTLRKEQQNPQVETRKKKQPN